ncbi:MAG: adenosylcobinamide amidohydrolase, partial [Candidatus Binatia bacterium]
SKKVIGHESAHQLDRRPIRAKIGKAPVLNPHKRSMNESFAVRADQDALIVSFPEPVRALSWAVLNGGFCQADHVINHHIRGDDARFCNDPQRWLEQAAARMDLQGKVVAMATAVEMKDLVQISLSGRGNEVTCLATVGCGNALSVGDPALAEAAEAAPAPLHTINMILAVLPGLTEQAMVEAIQIATEGRVRALYEAGIRSSASGLAATGTGTDCIAIVSLDNGRTAYCGKHTQVGELIGRAAYIAVKTGLEQASTQVAATAGGANRMLDKSPSTAPRARGTKK